MVTPDLVQTLFCGSVMYSSRIALASWPAHWSMKSAGWASNAHSQPPILQSGGWLPAMGAWPLHTVNAFRRTRSGRSLQAKQKNVPKAKKAPPVAGDVWTWTALCADSKLIVSFMVGPRFVDRYDEGTPMSGVIS